ncbi:MAG: hypothetical protein DHS20C15_31460 [Planctomycetota bacterium]|nr:MAG: hypothetical protein DHS20C15_31460 [Planctomycetota bacterium]
MARSAYKHPTVFVGCQYTPKPSFDAFRKALKGVPIEFLYAESAIKTKHVLERIRAGITRSDFCIFDITGWNPNVTLEVGLAEGLNKDYYVLFKPGKGAKREPPSDLKGVQRFQYSKVDGFSDDCLTFQLNMELVRRLTHPRHVWDRLSGELREKQFIFAMRILAHFKNHKVLKRRDLNPMAKGSYLRDEAREEVMEIVHKRGLLKGRLDGQRWEAGKSLFRDVKF